MGSAANYMDIMVDGLKKKLSVLNNIILLTNKEKELLSEEELDLDRFDGNMKEKALLVDQLTSLDDGFTSVFDRIKIELENNKEAFKPQIIEMKELISGITELSVKIQTQEARNKELADKQFRNAKREVKLAKKSGRTASNYYKSMNMFDSEPQFIDKKK